MTPSEIQRGLEMCESLPPVLRGRWEVGGPYPGTSVITMVDAGCGGYEPEPPSYEPVAIIDQRTKGDPSPVAQKIADFICYAHATLPAALCDLLAARAENERLRAMLVEYPKNNAGSITNQ